MRLSDHERTTIRAVAEAHFGDGCIVRLFGSRVDDARRGGDIDLHLEPLLPEFASFRQEIAFQRAIHDALGDQKIDVVVRKPGSPLRPLDRIAIATGIRL